MPESMKSLRVPRWLNDDGSRHVVNARRARCGLDLRFWNLRREYRRAQSVLAWELSSAVFGDEFPCVLNALEVERVLLLWREDSESKDRGVRFDEHEVPRAFDYLPYGPCVNMKFLTGGIRYIWTGERSQAPASFCQRWLSTLLGAPGAKIFDCRMFPCMIRR